MKWSCLIKTSHRRDSPLVVKKIRASIDQKVQLVSKSMAFEANQIQSIFQAVVVSEIPPIYFLF